MLDTTKTRHETLRKKIEQRANELKNQDVRNYVQQACEEIAQQESYSWITLRKIYYDYGG